MKRLLSLFLALVLALSLTWGVVPAYAEGDAQEPAEITSDTVTTGDEPDSTPTYNMANVQGEYLRSHTDKTSEIKDENTVPQVSDTEDWANLTCDD